MHMYRQCVSHHRHRWKSLYRPTHGCQTTRKCTTQAHYKHLVVMPTSWDDINDTSDNKRWEGEPPIEQQRPEQLSSREDAPCCSTGDTLALWMVVRDFQS